MILDYELEFSSAQAITATATSTKVVDLQSAKDLGVGEDVGAYARVGAAFNTLTSLAVAIQGCDDAAGTNAVDIISKSFTLAELTANKALSLPAFPSGTVKRFLRARYVVTGSNPSTGTITCGLVPSSDKAKPGNVAVKY